MINPLVILVVETYIDQVVLTKKNYDDDDDDDFDNDPLYLQN